MGLSARIRAIIARLGLSEDEEERWVDLRQQTGGGRLQEGEEPFPGFVLRQLDPSSLPPGIVLVPKAAGGWGVYSQMRPVGTGTPTVSTPVEIWDAQLGQRAPLMAVVNGVLGTRPEGYDPSGARMSTTGFTNGWQEAQATLAMATGVVADGTLLAAAGAGLKWEIIFLWAKASAAIAAGFTIADIKDTGGAVSPDPGTVLCVATAANRCYGFIGTNGESASMYGSIRVKQATANAAVTCDLAGGAGTEAITIRMLARKVT